MSNTKKITFMGALKTVAKMPKAFVKAMTGQDDFSKQVRREYRPKK
jgi:hypothetical protein